jgi:hypothetical protein
MKKQNNTTLCEQLQNLIEKKPVERGKIDIPNKITHKYNSPLKEYRLTKTFFE